MACRLLIYSCSLHRRWFVGEKVADYYLLFHMHTYGTRSLEIIKKKNLGDLIGFCTIYEWFVNWHLFVSSFLSNAVCLSSYNVHISQWFWTLCTVDIYPILILIHQMSLCISFYPCNLIFTTIILLIKIQIDYLVEWTYLLVEQGIPCSSLFLHVFFIFLCSFTFWVISHGHHHFEWQICDMVAVARLINATLVIPKLDKRSFWQDSR